MSNILYKSASTSRTAILRDQPGDPRLSSWEQLLECGSDKKIWAAINWRGEFNPNMSLESSSPSDQQFKEFFDKDDNQLPLENIQSGTYIPLLDNPISDVEVCKQIQDMEGDRAGRTDGNTSRSS